MKHLIVIATLILLPLSAISQTETVPEAFAIHNRDACASGGLPANCTDAQLGVALPGARTVDQTVYSTATAYRDAVIVAPQLRARLELRKNRAIERLVQMVVQDAAKCAAVMTAASLPVDVCK